MKNSIKLVMAFATIATTSLTVMESAQARKFNASRNTIERACDRNNGSAFGTRGSGDYGCFKDVAWIYCTADGRCESGKGWVPTSQKITKKPRALPKSRAR